MTHVYMWISRWILWIICGFTQKKTTDGSKMVYNSKRIDVDK